MDHAPQLRVVLALDRLVDAAQPERAESLALLFVGAIGRAALGDLQLGHVAAGASGAGASGDTGCSSWPSGSCWLRPSTWSMVSPRSSATSSGRRSDWSPATVAFTRLIGFCEPRLLERMSWMPASSSTARTPPPAMTPVPGEAGLSRTWPDPKMPVVWWVIVEPCLGTRKRFFFARSTPFWIASGTSLALP